MQSSHRCCAERRLLASWVAKARRRGVGQHQIVTWVRRKVGAHVTVFRTLADGTLGCAAPCLLCQRELLRFDLRVHCSMSPEEWWSGRLTDASAPPSKLTARQRMMIPGGGAAGAAVASSSGSGPASSSPAAAGGGPGASHSSGGGGEGPGGGGGDAAAAASAAAADRGRRRSPGRGRGGGGHKRQLSPA